METNSVAPKFDKFKWLHSYHLVKEKKLPDERCFVPDKNGAFRHGLVEGSFLKHFYSNYLRYFDVAFLQSKIDSLRNETAKAWANYAISRLPVLIKSENEDFEMRLEEVLSKLKLPNVKKLEIFKPYMPFFTNYDYFRFAYDNVDSSQYRYFYILLILFSEYDFPSDSTKLNSDSYYTCPIKKTCSHNKRCRYTKQCVFEELHYDNSKSSNDFQKKLTLDFLSLAPQEQQEKLLVKLYETFQQINQSGIFEAKLSLSYDKVLYGDGKPLTGRFFLRWDKVDFFNGYYLVTHPDVPFNHATPYRIEDKNSRKAFNAISGVFMKKLPPLYVEAMNGKIIQVLNHANLTTCITLMEHKVSNLGIVRKKASPKLEKKVLSLAEAVTICKGLKSKYLDHLCKLQLNGYKVICCIEHRVNSTGVTSTEYSFIFTIKETFRQLFLVYENSSDARCTYIMPISKNSWQESIDKIYTFFASNEINKRQLMASRLVDLKLPGDYDYTRVFHKNFLVWLDQVKYCS